MTIRRPTLSYANNRCIYIVQQRIYHGEIARRYRKYHRIVAVTVLIFAVCAPVAVMVVHPMVALALAIGLLLSIFLKELFGFERSMAMCNIRASRFQRLEQRLLKAKQDNNEMQLKLQLEDAANASMEVSSVDAASVVWDQQLYGECYEMACEILRMRYPEEDFPHRGEDADIPMIPSREAVQ